MLVAQEEIKLPRHGHNHFKCPRNSTQVIPETEVGVEPVRGEDGERVDREQVPAVVCAVVRLQALAQEPFPEPGIGDEPDLEMKVGA